MELLAQVDEIEQQLYGMDCGACGAPSCRALATDIAQGRASVEDLHLHPARAPCRQVLNQKKKVQPT